MHTHSRPNDRAHRGFDVLPLSASGTSLPICQIRHDICRLLAKCGNFRRKSFVRFSVSKPLNLSPKNGRSRCSSSRLPADQGKVCERAIFLPIFGISCVASHYVMFAADGSSERDPEKFSGRKVDD